MPRSFDTLYADVPADQRDALRNFRAAHPLRTVTVNGTVHGTAWDYIDAGTSADSPPVLILVGGLRVADAAFRSIQRLEPDFRVITPTYPALNTMSALADGLAGVLDAAGVDRAHVLSGSFGGMLALRLAQRHPDRIAKLVLSSTAIPTPQTAKPYRAMLRVLRWLPSGVVRNQMRARLLDIIAPPDESRAFWAAYLRELFDLRLDKAAALSTLRCMVDFAETAPRSPDDLPNWTGESLLITSDDDHTFDAEAQRALTAVLPDMQIVTLGGAGHSPAMTQPDRFFGAVRAFVE